MWGNTTVSCRGTSRYVFKMKFTPLRSNYKDCTDQTLIDRDLFGHSGGHEGSAAEVRRRRAGPRRLAVDVLLRGPRDRCLAGDRPRVRLVGRLGPLAGDRLLARGVPARAPAPVHAEPGHARDPAEARRADQ